MKQTLLWMTATILSFCLMAVAGRELSGEINTFEIIFFRSLFGLIVISVIIVILNKPQYFKTSQGKGHLLRNVFHFWGQYGWFVGLGVLPLSQVFAIEFTVPFWTAILAYLFLKEPLNIYKILAIVLAFMGVLLIVKPSLNHMNGASLMVLGAAICYAFAHTGTKFLSKHDHPITIVFYMCLIQLPMATIFMFQHWQMPNMGQWGWISLIACTALSAHFCMAKAMLTSPVTTVVTLDFIRLPVITIIGFFLYQEPFGLLSIVGSAFVFSAMILNLKPVKAKNNPVCRR